MRFLVDENLPGGITALLREYGHDVLDVTDSVHRGMPDDELWDLAIAESRIVITRDLDFPLQGKSGRPPGLVLIRAYRGSRISELVSLMKSALMRLDPSSLVDQITVIEPGRIRQRRYSSMGD